MIIDVAFRIASLGFVGCLWYILVFPHVNVRTAKTYANVMLAELLSRCRLSWLTGAIKSEPSSTVWYCSFVVGVALSHAYGIQMVDLDRYFGVPYLAASVFSEICSRNLVPSPTLRTSR